MGRDKQVHFILTMAYSRFHEIARFQDWEAWSTDSQEQLTCGLNAVSDGICQ